VAEIELRLLQRTDDRSELTCGEPSLDRFFQHYAGQTQVKLHLAVTYVAARETTPLGFATVAGGSLERRGVPDEALRRRLPDHPLPVLRLARLGVDQQAQGLGIGRALLRHVLTLAVAQRDQVGCIGVVTDAKPGAISFYEGLGFVALQGVREGLLHGEPTPMFLAMGTITAAFAPR
jgi:GNAT superfamily N-acetyltransferase